MTTNTTHHPAFDTGYVTAVLLATAAVLLGVVGYAAGFLGFVYNLMLPDAFARLDVITLAAVMGVAAFFSPCAFPLLPAYMTYQLQAHRGLARSLALGALAAGGVILVNVGIGLVIAALGAAAPFNPDPRQDPWYVLAPRLLGGLFVTYLGALYVLERSLSLGPLERIGAGVALLEGRPERAGQEAFLYGALYNVIGIGCTGALLLGLTLYALTVGGFWTALGAFAAFSAAMGALMLGVTALVGLGRPFLVQRLRAGMPAVRRVSGAVMLLVGGLTVAFVLQGNEVFTRIFFPFFR
jgi:cytochrome c-type biogenesis protein